MDNIKPSEIIEQVNLDKREIGSDKPLLLSPIEKFSLDGLDDTFRSQNAVATMGKNYFKIIIGKTTFYFNKDNGKYDGWERSLLIKPNKKRL